MKEENDFKVINVSEVYTTFMGEVNEFGIGHPVIFVRLGGCHLRCYKKTLGVLCDTPQSLEKGSGEDMRIESLIDQISSIKKETGISLVCLTGGDPLWRKPQQLKELFYQLKLISMDCVVETSGTISWIPFLAGAISPSFVLDYKLASAGLRDNINLLDRPEFITKLRPRDWVKMVVHDEADYEEAKLAVLRIRELQSTKTPIAMGCYWGGNITPFQLYKLLEKDGLLGDVSMNFQVHKMALASNFDVDVSGMI